MREVFESDTAFYYSIGLFVIAVYVAAVSVMVLFSGGVDRGTLLTLTVGFSLFMIVYFVSISAQRIEELEDV